MTVMLFWRSILQSVVFIAKQHQQGWKSTPSDNAYEGKYSAFYMERIHLPTTLNSGLQNNTNPSLPATCLHFIHGKTKSYCCLNIASLELLKRTPCLISL